MSDNEVVECMLIFLTECLYFPLVQSLHFICYTVLQTNEQDWKQLLRYRYENYQASLQHLGYLNEKTIKRFSWLNSLNMSVANNNKHNSKFEGEQNSPPRGRKKSSSQSKQVPKQFINPNTVREALKSPISSILQAAFGNKSEDEVVMDSDEDENVNDYDPFSDEDDKDETIDWFELEQKSNQSNQENRALQSEYIESPYDDSETSSVATEDYHQVSKTGSYARSPHKQLPEESHTGMTNKMQVYSGDEYFKIVKHDPRLYSNLLSYIGVVHEVIRTAQSKCLLAARSCKRKNEFAIFSALGSTVMETFKTLKMSEGQRGGQEVGQVYSTHPISKGEQIMVVTDDAPSMNRCMTTNFHQLVSCIFLNKLSTGYSFTLRPMGNAHMTPTTIIVEKVTARQSIDLFIPQKLSHQDFHSQPEQNNTSSCAKEKKLIDLSSYFNLSKAKKEDPVEVEDTRYFSDGL